MLSREERCTHCGGTFNKPKPVVAGPRAGQIQKACTKCGHIKYELPSAQPQVEQQTDAPSTATPPKTPSKWEWTF